MLLSYSDKDIFIKEAHLENLHGIADCHLISFPGRFMTEMGHKWICSLYKFFIKHPKGICYIAEDTTGKVIGLVAGGKPDIRDRFLRFAMLRYPHIIFWKFFTKASVRCVLIKELVRKITFKHEKNPSGNIKTQSDEIKQGNLLSICVLPDWQGSGIAEKLIESFQKACAAKGYKQLTLSVLSENSRAINFYIRHGWQEAGISGNSTKFVLEL